MDLPSPEQGFLMISVWNVVAALLRLVPIGAMALANIKTALKRVESFGSNFQFISKLLKIIIRVC